MKRIGPSAFRGNTAVRKVTLPDSIRVIDSFAFNGTQLEEINLPEGCTAIGIQAFQYTSLRHITIPSSVTEIGGAVFAGCSQLESVDMPVGNASYFTREGVLYNIPYEGALQILAYPAARAGREYVLPAEVCYVAGGAFNGSKLEHVELPDDLVLLPAEAFRGCTELKEIVIPASVRSIWEAAFMECSSLEKITLLGDPEEIIESAFGDPAARPGSPVICCKEGTFAMEFAQQYGFATEVLR